MSLFVPCTLAQRRKLSRIPAVRERGLAHQHEGSNLKLLTEKYGYDYEAVDRLAKEYVRGDVLTNLIESF